MNVLSLTYASLKWKAQPVFYNAEVLVTNERVLSLGTQPFLSAKVLISKSTDTEAVELRTRIYCLHIWL